MAPRTPAAYRRASRPRARRMIRSRQPFRVPVSPPLAPSTSGQDSFLPRPDVSVARHPAAWTEPASRKGSVSGRNRNPSKTGLAPSRVTEAALFPIGQIAATTGALCEMQPLPTYRVPHAPRPRRLEQRLQRRCGRNNEALREGPFLTERRK